MKANRSYIAGNQGPLRDIAEDMVSAADQLGPLKILNVRAIVERKRAEKRAEAAILQAHG